MTSKKPSGLIKNQPNKPNIQTTTKEIKKSKSSKNAHKNQDANIKVSQQTKNQLDLLMKLTDHSFGYEMIEYLIDNYVENNLDNDKKRAFKALSSL